MGVRVRNCPLWGEKLSPFTLQKIAINHSNCKAHSKLLQKPYVIYVSICYIRARCHPFDRVSLAYYSLSEKNSYGLRKEGINAELRE